MDVVRDTIRHNSWATSSLIAHLQSLSPQVLLLSAPGTYGQIGATLSHLLRAESSYLARLEGVSPNPTLQGTVELKQIATEARRLGQRWELLLEHGLDPAAPLQTMRGTQRAGTILAQAVNHAAEHRAHVCTVLGAHGHQPPAIDPFAYAEATGRED